MFAELLVRNVYASHRPSGENSELSGDVDRTSPNRVALRSGTEYVHNDTPAGVISLSENRSSLGDQDSATCEIPFSGLVNRSAAPLPSASCQNSPRSPSRSD